MKYCSLLSPLKAQFKHPVPPMMRFTYNSSAHPNPNVLGWAWHRIETITHKLLYIGTGESKQCSVTFSVSV